MSNDLKFAAAKAVVEKANEMARDLFLAEAERLGNADLNEEKVDMLANHCYAIASRFYADLPMRDVEYNAVLRARFARAGGSSDEKEEA